MVKMEPRNPNEDFRGAIPVEGHRQAFTFVELLVAIAIGALVLSAAALLLSGVSGAARSRGTYENVEIGELASANFYAQDISTRSVWFAPNFGLLARSEQMRSLFLADIQKASAVFCLPRSDLRYIHPNALNIPSTYALTNFDFRRVDTSEAFRQFMVAAGSSTASRYTSNPFGANGAARGCNLTVITVHAVTGTQIIFGPTYELDFVRVSTGTPGTFASVRRYYGNDRTVPTDMYEVFYPDHKDGTVESSAGFFVAASFERSGRTASTTIAANRVADKQPFYLVWWPDPTVTELPSASFAATNYKDAMRDSTAYFMVVPMFPSL
jgi:prepilin-type N-terminal cleavage/methylation domain-containing protein